MGTGARPAATNRAGNLERDGYLVLNDLLTDDEVQHYRDEPRRLRADENLRGSERVVPEPDSDEVHSIFEVQKVSDIFAELIHSERLTEIARQVLGSDVYVHQSRVNYKSGFGGAQFDWHSDFETWHAEDGMPLPRAFSISIGLTENFPYNGPLRVMPGSHKTFIPSVGETPADYHKESLQVRRLTVGSVDPRDLTYMAEKHGIQQITGRAGSAVMFDCNILHGSNSNITPFPRSNIFIVYNSIDNALGAPFAAPKPRPQHLGNRDFSRTG